MILCNFSCFTNSTKHRITHEVKKKETLTDSPSLRGGGGNPLRERTHLLYVSTLYERFLHANWSTRQTGSCHRWKGRKTKFSGLSHGEKGWLHDTDGKRVRCSLWMSGQCLHALAATLNKECGESFSLHLSPPLEKKPGSPLSVWTYLNFHGYAKKKKKFFFSSDRNKQMKVHSMIEIIRFSPLHL